MKKYLRLLITNWKLCFMRIAEFRLEVVSWSIHSVFWIGLTFLFVGLVFGQVTSVAGWTRDEVLLLAIIFGMFESFLWFFIYPSVINFSRLVRKGDLDFYLMKPVNTRFLLTFCRFEFDNYGRLFVLVILLFIFSPRLGVISALMPIVNFLTLFLLGVLMFYCLFFLLATLSFWFTDLWNLEDLLESIVDVGRFPTYIFERGFRVVFFYILPVAFVATFPAQALLGQPSFSRLVTGCLLVVGLFIASQLFWRYSLKNYTSASS